MGDIHVTYKVFYSRLLAISVCKVQYIMNIDLSFESRMYTVKREILAQTYFSALRAGDLLAQTYFSGALPIFK